MEPEIRFFSSLGCSSELLQGTVTMQMSKELNVTRFHRFDLQNTVKCLVNTWSSEESLLLGMLPDCKGQKLKIHSS